VPQGRAECFGTISLVFAGTGAVVIDDTLGGVTHVGIAATFGPVVSAIIYAICDISIARPNPAANAVFVAAGRFPVSAVGPTS